MFHQVRQAVTPLIPLAEVIRQWANISKELSETPRKRTYQTAQVIQALEKTR